MTREGCPACAHMDARTIDRFLVLPDGTPGKREDRSRARDFGPDRRAIARHEKRCLIGSRREEVERGVRQLAARHDTGTATTSTKGKN